MNIYVSNISFHTTEEILIAMFAKYGAVKRATIIRGNESGSSKAFGFVEMSSADAAYKAINELDGKEIQGRSLRVSQARGRYPENEKPSTQKPGLFSN